MEPQAAIKGLHHRAGKLKVPKARTSAAREGGSRVSYITRYTYRTLSRHKSRTALTVVAVSWIERGFVPGMLFMRQPPDNSLNGAFAQVEFYGKLGSAFFRRGMLPKNLVVSYLPG
jgi:hypothetical protein